MGSRLEGKNAIVTAAGQGIGKAIAIAFHRIEEIFENIFKNRKILSSKVYNIAKN